MLAMAGDPSQLGEATRWVIEQWAPVEAQADDSSGPDHSTVVKDVVAGVLPEAQDDVPVMLLEGESTPPGASSGTAADAGLSLRAQLQEIDLAASAQSHVSTSTEETQPPRPQEEAQTADLVDEQKSQPADNSPFTAHGVSKTQHQQAGEPVAEEACMFTLEVGEPVPKEVGEPVPEEASKSAVEARETETVPEEAGKSIADVEPVLEEPRKSVVEDSDPVLDEPSTSIVKEVSQPVPETVSEPVAEVPEVAQPVPETASELVAEVPDVVRAPPSPKVSAASAETKPSAKSEDLKRPCPTPARGRSPQTCNTPSSEKGRSPRKTGPAIQGSSSNGGNVGALRPRTPTARSTQQRKAASPASTGHAGSMSNTNHKVPSSAEIEQAEIAEKRRQMKLIAERNARHMTRMSAARTAASGSTEETAKDRSPRSLGASHRPDVKAQERRSVSLSKAGSGAGSGGTTPSSRTQQSKVVAQKRPTTASRPTGSIATPRKPSPRGELAQTAASSGVSTNATGKRGGALVTAPSTFPGKATGEAAALPGKATPSRPRSRPRTPTAKREQVAAAVAVFTRPGHGTKHLQLGPSTRPTAERRSPSQQKARAAPDRAAVTAAAVATVQATTANNEGSA